MGSLQDDYDLLLSAPSPVEAALAKDLLAERGIPSFTHGRDRDLAELGSGAHNSLTRPDVYVPKGMRARARAILDEAWVDAVPLADEGPSPPEDANDPKWSSAAPPAAPDAQRTPWTPMVIGVVVVAVVFVVLWAVAGR